MSPMSPALRMRFTARAGGSKRSRSAVMSFTPASRHARTAVDRFVHVEHERLLAEHVHAGLGRRQNGGQVEVMGQADVHRLHLRPLHDFRIVAGGIARAHRTAVRLGLGAFQFTVAGHFQPRLAGLYKALPAVEMRMGNAAAANDGYANWTVRRRHGRSPSPLE